MNKLAQEINSLLLKDETIKEYLSLKKEIENDLKLQEMYTQLDTLRKDICKNKEKDSSEYYYLLEEYQNDYRVKKYKSLKKEIEEFFLEISEILNFK